VKRSLVAGLIALVGGLMSPVATAGETAPPSAARLQAFMCQTALEPPQREFSVTAVMRPIAGTETLRLRFALLRAARPDGPLTAVSGRGLGDWLTPSDATLGQHPGDVWILSHPVFGTAAPYYYRFRVTFRWLGADGATLATTVRTSDVCFEPELRPHLLVASIRVLAASKPSLNRYVAMIENAGATAAGPFEVQFTPGPQIRTVVLLRAHARRRVVFVGPACATTSPRPAITVDPTHQVIDDLDPADNTLIASC
jgi:hypothetical protein